MGESKTLNSDIKTGISNITESERAQAALKKNEELQNIAERKKAEDALRNSEEQHRTILQTAIDGFWLVDVQGRLLEVNEAYCRMSGYSAQELLAMSITDLDALETGDDTVARVQKVMTQGKDRFESQHIRKDGSVFDVEVSIQYQSADGGQIVAFLRDITERKSIEEESRIKGIAIESSINAIAIADSDGNLTYVNDSFLNLWGYGNIEEVIGKSSLMFWNDPELAKTAFEVLLQSGRWSGELAGKKKDGSILTVQLLGNSILDSNSNVIGMMSSFIDITERKRTEEALVFNNIILRTQQELSLDGILVVDEKGGVLNFNQRFVDMWGIPSDIIESKSDKRALQSVMSKLTNPEEFIQKVKKLYDVHDEICRDEIVLKDDRVFDRYSAPMLSVEGKYYGRVWYFRDVTERKKVDEELRESERKLKELVLKTTRSQEEIKASYLELKASKDDLVRSEKLAYTGRIAASIAHEIRNPLTNVSMSIRQLKKSGRIKPEGHTHSEIIERNVERINFLITELLNCARPAKLNPVLYDINQVIKDALISGRSKIRSQKVKVIKSFFAKPSILKIDKEHMGRVLLNLITNAADAMPNGGNLTISTEISKDIFLIKIKDSGLGIPEKDVIKIFDPFFSTKPQGVGLGLTTCYGIVVSHGGTIEVESKWRKGTTFIISLPLSTHSERERERERERVKEIKVS